MNGRERILVVDDDPGMRRALHRILAPAYEVETAAGEQAARARLGLDAPGRAGSPRGAGVAGPGGADGGGHGGHGGHGGEIEFALALIDVRLADGDGYHLCQAIRERRPQTDIILITGSLSEPDDKLYRSLEQGAFYFLFKPFDRRVLLALVERCLRLQAERAAKERFASTLAADLERARRFQRSLLPRGAIAAGGWRLEGRLRSCDALGGDLYQAQVLPEGVVFAVSDVVGHGVAAAMYAGMLRSTLDAARRRSPEPAELIGELLDGIDFFDAAKYATLFYGLLLPDGGLRYVNAGHPPALWQHDGRIDRLPATGFFLSTVFRDRPHAPGAIAMAAGDRLLVYTDGASEACGPAGEELGTEGLAAELAACRGRLLADTLDALLERVLGHCDGRPLDDDVTLLLIERTGA
ncbi:MAG TPA: fused response regulator/phosphatase [Thermoanaerobaculia bacterium]|nr:fused response regulator/phosphatase [Thermoanaerobaculia bacterium]